MIRLVPNHAARVQRARSVTFTFDDEAISGFVGETVATALQRGGHRLLRHAPEDGGARGAFCCMGLCQECLVQVGGRTVESCRLLVSADLTVTSLKRGAQSQ